MKTAVRCLLLDDVLFIYLDVIGRILLLCGKGKNFEDGEWSHFYKNFFSYFMRIFNVCQSDFNFC